MAENEKIKVAENKTYSFYKDHKPEFAVKPGESFMIEAEDCFSGQVKNEETTVEKIDWDKMNPVSGPVFIEGAEPGDIIQIEIEKIELADEAVMVALPREGLFGDYFKQSYTKMLPLQEGKIEFSEDIKLNQEPMVGVLGVAPAGEKVSTGIPGPHGGNMDCKLIKEGSSVYLPVNVPGVLLAAGDMHALMGDGEVVFCGAEAAGQVKMNVNLKKELNIPTPLIVTENKITMVASAGTLYKAVKKSAEKMLRFLTENLDFTQEQAGMFLSLQGNSEICQVVDPLQTARFTISKDTPGLEKIHNKI